MHIFPSLFFFFNFALNNLIGQRKKKSAYSIFHPFIDLILTSLWYIHTVNSYLSWLYFHTH